MASPQDKLKDFDSTPSALERDPRWHLVTRVAASPILARSDQLREMLFFIVRQTLLHPDEPIREDEIAQKALGRSANFNPVDDNIVRVQMAHLRKRLEQYFSDKGKDEEIVISVARGSYRPIFTPRSNGELPEIAHNLPQPTPSEAPQPSLEQAALNPEKVAPAIVVSRTRWRSLVVCGLVLLSACVYLFISDLQHKRQIVELQKTLAPWRAQPTLAAFWSNFFDSKHETDLILSDNTLLLDEQIIRESPSFTAYINHDFPSELQKKTSLANVRLVLDIIGAKQLGSISEFNLAQKIRALDPKNEHIQFFGARQFPPAFLEQNNAILIGGMISNPWEGVFDDKLNFGQITRFVDTGSTDVENRSPQPGEQKGYSTSDNVGYCDIAYLPQPNRGTSVLLIEGTGSEATEAAGDFLASEQQMANLLSRFHTKSFPPFEVLLKISQLRGTPLTATVEAYRVFPLSH